MLSSRGEGFLERRNREQQAEGVARATPHCSLGCFGEPSILCASPDRGRPLLSDSTVEEKLLETVKGVSLTSRILSNALSNAKCTPCAILTAWYSSRVEFRKVPLNGRVLPAPGYFPLETFQSEGRRQRLEMLPARLF